jgi:hypothetical protein
VTDAHSCGASPPGTRATAVIDGRGRLRTFAETTKMDATTLRCTYDASIRIMPSN